MINNSFSKTDSFYPNNLKFKGKIIDSHAHLGSFNDKVHNQELDFKPDTLTKHVTLENGDTVEKVLVSNLSCISTKDNIVGSTPRLNEIDGNIDILNQCKNTIFYPLAVCQPKHGKSDNIEKLVSENKNKFVGLKFHPEYLNLPANDPSYEPYMKVAEKHNLPCLFHSATGVSDPEHIYELAKKYPKVPVILGHMKLATGDPEEIKKINNEATSIVNKALKNNSANMYLEVSWAHPEAITDAIKQVGAERVIFGTDAPLQPYDIFKRENISYTEHVNQVKNKIKETFDNSDEIIDKVFYKNAENLFFSPKNSSTGQINNTKGKGLKIMLLLTAAIGIAAGVIYKINAQKQTNPQQKK